jgi:hypothetical protein
MSTSQHFYQPPSQQHLQILNDQPPLMQQQVN